MSFLDRAKRLLDTALKDHVFGEKINYRPIKGGSYFIRGIFDESFQFQEFESGINVSATGPNVGISLSELGFKPSNKDLVEIRGETFTVVDHRPDGQDGTTLFLQRRTK